MKYGFSTDVKEGSGPGFPVGITEGCEMTNVVFNGEDQYPNLEFTFKAPNSGELKHKEFAVNPDSEWAQQGMERMNSRVVHILRRFMTKEEAKIPEVDSFEAYAKAVVKLIGSKYKGVKLRVKAAYNKKGYVAFPMFPDFLENATVVPDAADTKLRITAYDNMVRPTPTKPEATNGTPQPVPEGVAAGTDKPTDDLPF